MAWRQRVVIVGAGFAGLTAARALRHEPVEILLLDRNNHHLFQPLLYQVATSALSPAEIAMPIRAILRKQRNVELTFCVIGGGPTGVELAGALSELARAMARRDFRHIRPEEIGIVLVEGGPAILSAFSEPLRARAVAALEARGVSVRSSSRVVNIDATGVVVADDGGSELHIAASTVLWAAGVRASPLTQTLGVPLDRGGRVIVDASLNVPGYEEVFCAGDLAACTDAKGVAVPGVAPAASQQGRFVAAVIARRVRGHRSAESFRYVNKGKLATIGRSAAVAEFGRLELAGFVAWVLWLVVHICFLVGFRNRYLVFCQWVWHYFTYQGGARLITGPRESSVAWPTQPRRLAMERGPVSVRPSSG